MAGKKKKSLANKLAKMSDEDRARYLQHRAEMEEEAKRRKEQLIGTFMKKKIKKEEVFSRLNLAKINLNWHQILRQIKIKEMKDNVIYLKRWIEQTIEFKNDRIAKLVQQLEEAEEQYLNNFNSHTIHVDRMINDQHEYIEILQNRYKEELFELLEQYNEERKSIMEKSRSNIEYLKTVTHGQNAKTAKKMEEKQEVYNKKLYEMEHSNRQKLSNLLKTRSETLSAIWLQLLQLIRMHVEKTDKIRRSHLQFLRKMDTDSAEEIQKNEERIREEEEVLNMLKSNFSNLSKSRSDTIKELGTNETNINLKFLKTKRTLQKQLVVDEKNLRFLVSSSTEILNYFNNIWKTGQQLLFLSETNEKYQSDKEKIVKWLPVIDNIDENCKVIKKSVKYRQNKEENGLTDDEKLYQKELLLPKLPGTSVMFPKKENTKLILNTKSKSVIYQDDVGFGSGQITKMIQKSENEPLKSSSTKTIFSTPEIMEQENVEPGITINDRDEEKCEFNGNDFLQATINNLNKLEKFWMAFGKVQVDVIELKNEHKALKIENKKLQTIIKAVLESVALKKNNNNNNNNSKISSNPVSLYSRATYSAPLKRIMST